MTDDAFRRGPGKANVIRRIAPLLLIIASSITGILLVELYCRLFSPLPEYGQDKAMRRVVFFDGGGAIFQNHGDIFTYLPHDEVRNFTGFFRDDDGLRVEYDYRFRTNNFGLVQDSDILPDTPSFLLLGDSFTEGQGAEPWFRLVSPEIAKLGYQGVNGGLLATGFAQWLKLERYLVTQDVRVEKVVVLFISQDYHRPVTNIPPAVFQCFSAPPLCRVDESYFYRLPPRADLPLWIAKIRAARGPTKLWLSAHAATLLPATYHVYKYLKEHLLQPPMLARAEQESHAAVGELIKIYGPNNVAFLHLPQKDEIDKGPSNLGLRARRAIEDAGGKLFDGFKLCGLTATDYYPNDEHPNSTGYAKIAACLTSVLKEMVATAK